MTTTPRVSVLMPVFKPDERFLRQAIDSLRAQTIDGWELVVVEDPPASNAREVITSFGDARLRHHLRAKRSSLPDALNDGLRQCRAPLVARLDGDDICVPDRLQRQCDYLDAHPGVAVIG